MARRDEGQDDGDGKDQDALAGWMPVLAALPLLLFGVVSASVMMQREATRPVVGDIVVFRTGMQDREFWRVAVPATIVTESGEAGRACVLNSSVIGTEGGSLVVEARLGGDPPLFRLHWAGRRSDVGAQDCGPAADLLVGRIDLRKLATAAGGFGVNKRMETP